MDLAAPLDVCVEVRSDDHVTLGAFRCGGGAYEQMVAELSRALLRELRATLGRTLTTRLGVEAKKQIELLGDQTECDEHGVERARCGCVAGANDPITFTMNHDTVASVADELARNATQSLIGSFELIEEV